MMGWVCDEMRCGVAGWLLFGVLVVGGEGEGSCCEFLREVEMEIVGWEL